MNHPLADVLETLGDAFTAIDRQWRITYMNRLALERVGRTREEVVGRVLWEALPVYAGTLAEKMLRKAMEERRFMRFEAVGLVTGRWYETSIHPSSDGVLVYSREIQERKAVEKALTESESRFRTLADSAPVLIWMSGKQKEGVYFNTTWLEFTGRELERELGDGWLESVHPDDVDDGLDVCARAFERREAFQTQFRMRRADGEYRWMLDTGVPRFEPDGEFAGYIGSCIDVTERHEAEENLRKSEAQFRQLANALPQLVWMARPDGCLDWYNDRWYEFTGLPRGLAGDESWKPVLHPDDVERCLDTWYACVHSGQTYQIEYRFLDRRAGAYRWFLGRAYPVRDEQDRIVRWFGACTDIDDAKQAQAALQDAARRKDEFLATLAHELRNPLAPIATGVQLLRLAEGNPAVREKALGTIERQLSQMVRLIDDLLDVSRISRGKIELRKEKAPLAAIIESALETSRPGIEERGHHLDVSLPQAPLLVEADATRLAQVFANLLNNSAKYTERGGRICLAALQENGEAVISVKDTGVGIPAEMLPRVFELFVQVDGSLEKAQGGLGIGLTLVKRLVEMHGGRVEARSEGFGCGAEFIVRLPLAAAAPSASPGSSESAMMRAGRRRRILVADDNHDAATTLGLMLRLMGHDTRIAHDGLQALEIGADFRPELIFLDIGMPRLNGYEAARRVRESAWGSGVTLVALTGWGQESDRRRSQEAGFHFHLVKPPEPAVLEQVLNGASPNDAAANAGCSTSK